MISALIKGTVLGGLVLFVWSAISWMVLPWRTWTMHGFSDEKTITQAIKTSVPQNGIYLLPAEQDTSAMSPEQKKAAEENMMNQMMNGPMIFASVRLGPMRPFGLSLGIQVLGQMVGAFLATLLLLNTSIQSYGKRLLFVLGIALSIAIMGNIENWNWWSFSTIYTLQQMADVLIGWFFAGLVISRMAIQKRLATVPSAVTAAA
ncbi:MAG TPA: hypothetical protein VFC63_26820 [Blastocatellia bacterium]|nr:hypothetical protein [Blastocatellia bacterium]